MSYKIVDEVLDRVMLLPLDKLVLASLARHANDEQRISWPSVDTIIWETSLNRRTVQRRLRALEICGIITDVSDYYEPDDAEPTRKRAKKYGGAKNTTRYRLATKAEWDTLMDRYSKDNPLWKALRKHRPAAADESVHETQLTATGSRT
jgi:Helix-turn-helix domain